MSDTLSSLLLLLCMRGCGGEPNARAGVPNSCDPLILIFTLLGFASCLGTNAQELFRPTVFATTDGTI